MANVKITIKLDNSAGTVKNPSGSLEHVDPPGYYVFKGVNGSQWNATVEPGVYIFYCEAAGNPGAPFGPITVVDAGGNPLAGPKTCKIRKKRTGLCTLQFVVTAAAAKRAAKGGVK